MDTPTEPPNFDLQHGLESDEFKLLREDLTDLQQAMEREKQTVGRKRKERNQKDIADGKQALKTRLLDWASQPLDDTRIDPLGLSMTKSRRTLIRSLNKHLAKGIADVEERGSQEYKRLLLAHIHAFVLDLRDEQDHATDHIPKLEPSAEEVAAMGDAPYNDYAHGFYTNTDSMFDAPDFDDAPEESQVLPKAEDDGEDDRLSIKSEPPAELGLSTAVDAAEAAEAAMRYLVVVDEAVEEAPVVDEANVKAEPMDD